MRSRLSELASKYTDEIKLSEGFAERILQFRILAKVWGSGDFWEIYIFLLGYPGLTLVLVYFAPPFMASSRPRCGKVSQKEILGVL
jgi:hypothetical protein